VAEKDATGLLPGRSGGNAGVFATIVTSRLVRYARFERYLTETVSRRRRFVSRSFSSFVAERGRTVRSRTMAVLGTCNVLFLRYVVPFFYPLDVICLRSGPRNIFNEFRLKNVPGVGVFRILAKRTTTNTVVTFT